MDILTFVYNLFIDVTAFVSDDPILIVGFVTCLILSIFNLVFLLLRIMKVVD